MTRILVLSLLILSGCSAYNNKFDCPYGNGVGCASVSKVNRMIDNQQIDLDEEVKSQKRKIHVYYGPSKMSQLMEIETQ